MSDVYNLSEFDSSNDIFSLFKASNNLTDMFYFTLIFMFAIGIIIFIGAKSRGYDNVVALISASFTSSIIGAVGFSFGFVPKSLVFIPIMLLIGSVIGYMIQE